MKDGFVRVCAATPDIRVADCDFNTENIIKTVHAAAENGAKLVVLPELCITGYTCGDLFLQQTLISAAKNSLGRICRETGAADIIAAVGVPLELNQKLYNCAAIIFRGRVIAVVPKTFLPNYGEFYERRHFTPAPAENTQIELFGESIPFGTKILIKDKNIVNFVLAAELCEDLWTAVPPSSYHACAGATVIANLSAGNEIIAKSDYRKSLVAAQSARLFAGYVYASAGEGESTTDLVFAGDNIICENGALLARSEKFKNGAVYSELDLERITAERRKTTTFLTSVGDYLNVYIELERGETVLSREFCPTPFVPGDFSERTARCGEILSIQSMGLKKRLAHTGAKRVCVGISGGLDSTLALLVCARAFDAAGLDRRGIMAVTMPCFGTTGRTYKNACAMSEAIGAELVEVDIRGAVLKHFEDIGQDAENYDVTYENSQARERTQVLMDLANKNNALVIGTGDLSELALGWATYNGDHMSMYAVNVGVPKTLIRYLVEFEADSTDNEALAKTLRDILDTPVSPELLPPRDGEISQKTEHIVGPYILHDFFLYYMLRFGFSPAKLYRLACRAFAGSYDAETVLAWEKVFYRRFFTQQFKRSCIPDGPKVGSVALSPRGDWRMPSDSSRKIWEKELENIGK